MCFKDIKNNFFTVDHIWTSVKLNKETNFLEVILCLLTLKVESSINLTHEERYLF